MATDASCAAVMPRASRGSAHPRGRTVATSSRVGLAISGTYPADCRGSSARRARPVSPFRMTRTVAKTRRATDGGAGASSYGRPMIATPPQKQSTMATASLVLGLAGLLPIPGLAGSIAALVCGYASLGTDDNRDRARAGIVLGWIGVAAPLVFLFVYCVLLGYPFPIERYHPS